MVAKRKKIEETILEKFFPRKFQFNNVDQPDECLNVGIKTQSGKVYQIKIELKGYPLLKPDAYIIYPESLKDYSGKPLTTVSHQLHLLLPKNGAPQICHYKPVAWNQNITLYKVILKCRVWLEAYEGHLQAGKPIDDFLKS